MDDESSADDGVVVISDSSAAEDVRDGEAARPIDGWWQRKMDVLDDVPPEVERELERCFIEAPQPASLLLPLLPFQRESLTWMIAQEHSPFRGGILADEMGAFTSECNADRTRESGRCAAFCVQTRCICFWLPVAYWRSLLLWRISTDCCMPAHPVLTARLAHSGLGKTIQSIALILSNRDDGSGNGSAALPIGATEAPAPRVYESEGALRLRTLAEKEAAKRAAKEEREFQKLLLASDRAMAKEERAKKTKEPAAARVAAKAAAASPKAVAAGDDGGATVAGGDTALATSPAATLSVQGALSPVVAVAGQPSPGAASGSASAAGSPGPSPGPALAAAPWRPLRDTSTPLDHLAAQQATPCRATLVVCPVVVGARARLGSWAQRSATCFPITHSHRDPAHPRPHTVPCGAPT